jgi:hypothetical protein
MLHRRDRHYRPTIQRSSAKATGRGFGGSNLQAKRLECVHSYQIATYRSVTPANVVLTDAGTGLSAREIVMAIALTGWLWTQLTIDFLSNKLAAWNPQLDR